MGHFMPVEIELNMNGHFSSKKAYFFLNLRLHKQTDWFRNWNYVFFISITVSEKFNHGHHMRYKSENGVELAKAFSNLKK